MRDSSTCFPLCDSGAAAHCLKARRRSAPNQDARNWTKINYDGLARGDTTETSVMTKIVEQWSFSETAVPHIKTTLGTRVCPTFPS